MKIIDTHVHLGDIYGFSPFKIKHRSPKRIHPNKPNVYEQMGYRNIYFGSLNYLFKPLVSSAAREMTPYANLPNLLDSMQENNISKSVVLPIEPNVRTKDVVDACKKKPDLIPFCSVHPRDSEKTEKLNNYVEMGCRGLKIHPVINEVAPDAPETMELLEEVNPLDIPVIFHAGWGALGESRYGFAYHFHQVLETFPQINFIIAHMGFYQPGPFLKLMQKHPNAFCDLSWQPARIIRKAVNLLGEDRIMFGTDWPYNLQSTSLDIVLRITRGNAALRDKILYENAAQIIQLS